MFKSILATTSLPNLHPAIVHFPIALLALAVGLDAVALMFRRPAWLDRAVAVLFVLGAIAAGAAFLTGRQAEDGLTRVPPAVEPLIARHADAARWTAITFGVLAVLRAALAWRRRRDPALRPAVAWFALAAASFAGLGLLLVTADRGGTLVFAHGVAVAREAADAPAASVSDAEPIRPEQRREAFAAQADGTMVWRPSAADADRLFDLLRPLDQESRNAMRPAPDRGAGGLALHVEGPALLVIPGTFADVRIETRVDASAFRGRFGLAHHVRGPDRAGLFWLSTDGEAQLEEVEPDGRRLLDTGRYAPARGSVQMGFNAAAGHFKGMVNGSVVCHGHGEPGDAAPAGFFLDGQGTLVIEEVRVVPIAGHR